MAKSQPLTFSKMLSTTFSLSWTARREHTTPYDMMPSFIMLTRITIVTEGSLFRVYLLTLRCWVKWHVSVTDVHGNLSFMMTLSTRTKTRMDSLVVATIADAVNWRAKRRTTCRYPWQITMPEPCYGKNICQRTGRRSRRRV